MNLQAGDRIQHRGYRSARSMQGERGTVHEVGPAHITVRWDSPAAVSGPVRTYTRDWAQRAFVKEEHQ